MNHKLNELQIQALVEEWAEAARAKNISGVLANHTDDIVMFDVPVPIQSRGMDEYRKTWELFFANSPGGPGAFDVTELQITAGDDVAYCHAILNVMGTTGRLTIGLRKENERWVIAHEHHSYPLELEE